MPPAGIRIWDLPVRVFHWSLAALLVFSFVTGKAGGFWLTWHMRSGYAILALLFFRLAWGFVGSDNARFAQFVRGPRAALEHARLVISRRVPELTGHNPLGGWMVLAMLALVALQAFTGLFADDEIATQGPLAAKASNAWVARMTAIHTVNEWLIVAAVVVHVGVVAYYQWGLRSDIVGPMWHGYRRDAPGPAASGPRHASPFLALALLALAAAAVYAIVVVYPRGA